MISFFRKKEETLPSCIASVEENVNLRVIRLKGPLDMSGLAKAVEFKKRMRSRPDFEYKNTLMDFKDVTYIDSVAIGEIIETLAELKESHHKLGIINLTENVRSLLEVLKVNKLILEYPTEAEAIKNLAN